MGERHHTITAAEWAMWSGKADVIKVLKLKPNAEQARPLLALVQHNHAPDLLRALLDVLPGAQPLAVLFPPLRFFPPNLLFGSPDGFRAPFLGPAFLSLRFRFARASSSALRRCRFSSC